MRGEEIDGLLDVNKQKIGHLSRETTFNKNTLECFVRKIAGKRVGGYLPASHTKSVRQFVKCKTMLSVFRLGPDYRRDSLVWRAVVNYFEAIDSSNLLGTVPRNFVRTAVDGCVASFAETDEVKVLSDYLSCGTREIDLECRHVTAQITNMKNEFIGQVRGLPEQHPANPERR